MRFWLSFHHCKNCKVSYTINKSNYMYYNWCYQTLLQYKYSDAIMMYRLTGRQSAVRAWFDSVDATLVTGMIGVYRNMLLLQALASPSKLLCLLIFVIHAKERPNNKTTIYLLNNTYWFGRIHILITILCI